MESNESTIAPAAQVPQGWTREQDAGSFVQNFSPEGSDLYAAAVERIAFERNELECLLAELIGDFAETPGDVLDLANDCLSSNARVDFLMSVIPKSSLGVRLLTRIEEDLRRVSERLAHCDTIMTKYLFEREKVWLLELGRLIDDLFNGRCRLRESIRQAFKLRPRLDQVSRAVGSSN